MAMVDTRTVARYACSVRMAISHLRGLSEFLSKEAISTALPSIATKKDGCWLATCQNILKLSNS